MSIEADRISKVIIGSEWFVVAPGTFEVMEMSFVDDSGMPTHPPSDVLAYHFFNDNKDEYWGPLAAIQLIKLREP